MRMIMMAALFLHGVIVEIIDAGRGREGA